MTLISQRMMPKSKDPQMAQQQKMMTFMMVAFGVIFYGFSSGLLLYFLTSAALGIVEQKIIRAELAEDGIGDTAIETLSLDPGDVESRGQTNCERGSSDNPDRLRYLEVHLSVAG